jgi:alginate O-acetyltransferase complex protein AlgI
MYFHSVPFFSFLFLVAFLAPSFSAKNRWGLLLGASWLFYAWHSVAALGFLFFVILFSYRIAIVVSSTQNQTARGGMLCFAILVKVGLIGLAKYFFKDLFPGYIVPLGLSFYSFQASGYLIDVYRRQQLPELHLGRYALFVSFFPTLLSGPIERSSSLLPQLAGPDELTRENTTSNGLLFYSGLFKKLVVADALAKFVGPVFANPDYFGGPTLFVAIAIARYMIFADFSGYADMAVASAGFLGVRVRQNFNRPFFATSLIDYWRRWHISLHDWMKDYVFFSLSATSAGRAFGIYFCLIVSFLFMGFWHDVGWTFLAVGLWHGIFISLDYLTRDARDRFETRIGLPKFPIFQRLLRIAVTLVFFVLPPTVFFLSKSIDDAFKIFGRIFQGNWGLGEIEMTLANLAGQQPESYRLLLQTLIFVAIIETLHVLQAQNGIRNRIKSLPQPARLALYALLFVILIVFAQPFGERTYVYFQF